MCHAIAAELYGWGVSVVAVNGGYLFVGGGVDYATFDSNVHNRLTMVHGDIATLIREYLSAVNYRNGLI